MPIMRDAREAVLGGVLPFGGRKGYGLSEGFDEYLAPHLVFAVHIAHMAS